MDVPNIGTVMRDEWSEVVTKPPVQGGNKTLMFARSPLGPVQHHRVLEEEGSVCVMSSR